MAITFHVRSSRWPRALACLPLFSVCEFNVDGAVYISVSTWNHHNGESSVPPKQKPASPYGTRSATSQCEHATAQWTCEPAMRTRNDITHLRHRNAIAQCIHQLANPHRTRALTRTSRTTKSTVASWLVRVRGARQRDRPCCAQAGWPRAHRNGARPAVSARCLGVGFGHWGSQA